MSIFKIVSTNSKRLSESGVPPYNVTREVVELMKVASTNILSKLGSNDLTHAPMIGFKRGIIEF